MTRQAIAAKASRAAMLYDACCWKFC